MLEKNGRFVVKGRNLVFKKGILLMWEIFDGEIIFVLIYGIII